MWTRGGHANCVHTVVECPHGVSLRAQPGLVCGVPVHRTTGAMHSTPRVSDRSCWRRTRSAGVQGWRGAQWQEEHIL
eukprot:2686960-Alexandrium_andersonii.AAC.1